MRVLLVSVNREDFPDPVYPLGLALVGTAARKSGHRVDLLDLRLEGDALEERVTALGPGVVGIGLRNVDNLTWGRSVSYLPAAEEALGRLRRVFHGPVVLGGSGYSLFPLELLERLDVRYGISGEGETAFPALLGALERSAEPEGIPGLSVRFRPGVVVSTPVTAGPLPRPLDGFDGDLSSRYLAEGAAVGIQTKRGCPFRCSYCTYPALEGCSVRLRDPREVVDEVEHLVGHGVREVFFVDDAFNAPAGHAEAISRLLYERRVPVSWTAFAHPRGLSPTLAAWLKKSGCAGLEFGTDSLSDAVLEQLDKGFTADDAARSAHATWEAGVPAAHYLLLGGPGETEATLEQTFAAADGLPPSAVIAMVGVRLYPDTPLAARARKEGLARDGRSLLEPLFYLSPGISADNLVTRLAAHARARGSWVVPSLGMRCNPEVLRRLRGKGGPTWRHLVRPRSYDPA